METAMMTQNPAPPPANLRIVDIKGPTYSTLKAYLGNGKVPVGSIRYHENDERIYIYFADVQEHYQRRGIGTALYHEMVRRGKVIKGIISTEAGHRMVYPTTNPILHHGTFAQFDRFEPKKDIGTHFGSERQARMIITRKTEWTRQVKPSRIIKILVPEDARWILTEDPGAKITGEWLLGQENISKILNREPEYAALRQKLDDVALARIKLEYRRAMHPLKSSQWERVNKAINEVRKQEEKLNKVIRNYVRASLMSKGYNGLKYKNEWERPGYSYDILDPNQFPRIP